MKDIHDDNKKKRREWAPLFNSWVNQKRKVSPPFEVGSESYVVEETPDGVAKVDRKTNVFEDRVNRVVRDRVESLRDVKKEHGVLFLPIQSFVE